MHNFKGFERTTIGWPLGIKADSVIAKGIGELHGKRTPSAVLSSQWSEGATAICQVKLLCKTTGEVTFRCVHSGVSNMWRKFVGMAGTSSSYKHSHETSPFLARHERVC